MKAFNLVCVLALATFLPCIGGAAQWDMFLSYQGRLKVGGGTPDPSSDRFDLRFRLYGAATGGGALDEATVQGVMVDSNGLFNVLIDAGPMWSSSGLAHWVELDVRRSGGASNYVTLSPRQRITAVPDALRANQAETLSGPLPAALLPPTAARLDQPQTFTAPPNFMPASGPPFTVGLTDTVQKLSADLLDGLDSSAFWTRRASGMDELIGPNDNGHGLNLMLGTERAMRFQPGSGTFGPNIIGGSSANTITQTVSGSVIGGGGSTASPNSIASHGAFVGAGRNNTIKPGANYATLAGGDGNDIGLGAYDSVIGGGSRQMIGMNSIYAGILGGYNNVVASNSRFAGVLLGDGGLVRENSDFALVLSGGQNSIGPLAPNAAILSGAANKIEWGANHSLIGSGQQNLISTQANHSAVMGGQLNRIHSGAQRSFIGGGDYNEVGPMSYSGMVGGGSHNRIEAFAAHSAVLGGQNNLVRTGAAWSVVLGGVGSVAGAPFAIAGGHGAKAEHSGSIVLADGQYADFGSSNANEFAVRAAGGVRFVTAGAGLFVDGQRMLSSGGTVVTNGGNAETLDGYSSEQFWKLSGNAGTAAGVNFLGTTDDQALELKVKNQRALRLEPTPGSPNIIGGDDGNSISAGVRGGTIGGGGSPGLFGVTFPNRVTDSYGIVAGGLNNLAGDDDADTSDNLGAAVVGGTANQAAAEWTFVGGGSSNVVRAAAGAIAGGQQNQIETNAPFAAIVGGLQAKAALHGQFAHASGGFTQAGDAQASLYVLRGTTTNGGYSELFLDGVAQRLQLPLNSVWTYDILVVALAEPSFPAGAGYQIRGVVKRDTFLGIRNIGTPTLTVLGEDAEDLFVGALGDNDYDALRIIVGGADLRPGTSAPIRWVASVRTVEVTY